MDAARLARIFWISMSTEVTQNPASEDSFAALFEESLKRQEMRQGEVITAEVIRVDHNYVVVNAGLKSESYVPVEEFYNDRGELEVQEGDFVSVAIDSLEDGFGAIPPTNATSRNCFQTASPSSRPQTASRPAAKRVPDGCPKRRNWPTCCPICGRKKACPASAC